MLGSLRITSWYECVGGSSDFSEAANTEGVEEAGTASHSSAEDGDGETVQERQTHRHTGTETQRPRDLDPLKMSFSSVPG